MSHGKDPGWLQTIEDHARVTFIKIQGIIFVQCAVIALLAAFFLPFRVQADGGAPNLAYVAGTGHGVSVIDVRGQKVTDTFTITGDPQAILLSSDGRLLYATQPAQGRVSVIAAKTKQAVCSATLPGQPALLALDPGSNTLYVGGKGANSVTALDPMTCAVRHIFNLDGEVYGLAVAVVGNTLAGVNGNQLWVASTNALDAFDTGGRQLARVPLPAGPRYLCIPPGTTVYATMRQGTVEAVDLNTRRVLPPLLMGSTYGPMDYDATTGEVYVPDLQQHRVDVLAPVNAASATVPHEPRRTFSFNSEPQSIAITNDGQLGFVALVGGDVAMLDIPGRQTVTTIHTGGNPHFIITGTYPSWISLTPQQTSLRDIVATYSHYVGAAIVLIAAAILIYIGKRRQKQALTPPL